MKNYEVIFFDLDGTLTASGPGIKNGVKYALHSVGMEEDREEALQSFIGPPLIQRFMELYGFDEPKARELATTYRIYYSEKGVYENSVFDGVPEMLMRLRKAGKKLVVTTSKPYQYADLVMDYFDLGQYFDFVASANVEEGRSTKSQVLDHAFATLQIEDRSTVILVGDRMYDAIGARDFGIDCMGVLYGYGSREELEAEGVQYIAETVPQIADLLLQTES